MMNILCIETSGAYCSLALAAGDNLADQTRRLERSHNQHLLVMLDELFAQLDLTPADLDVVGFSSGPGSFTGVRMAASVSQALALTADCGVVPVSSSRVLAGSAMAAGLASGKPGELVCSIRSRGQAYYLSCYRLDGDDLQSVRGDELVTAAPAWLGSGEDCTLVGECPAWLDGQVQAQPIAPQAVAMLDAVRSAHAQGRSLDPEQALPSYFEGDSPWRPVSA